MNTWTAEQTEQLKDLWSSDLFIKEIAETLDRTENAIKAKVNKLGLPRRKKGYRPKAVKVQGRDYQAQGHSMKTRKRRKAKPIDHPPSKTPTALIDLKSNQCAFPIGDPKDADFHFCGAEAKGTYCEEHRKICYIGGVE